MGSTSLGTNLGNLAIITPDNGVFAIRSDLAAHQQVLLGFDPLQGHSITGAGQFQLQLVNGTLYAGNQSIAQVLSPTADASGWQPLAYVGDAVLRGTTSVAVTTTAPLALTEDNPLTRSFADLLGAAATSPFTVVAVSGDGHLEIKRNGNSSTSSLTVTPNADFNGLSNLLVTIQEGESLRTLQLPVAVAAMPDAPRPIGSLALSTQEDTALRLPISALTAAFLDPDRFDLVEFIGLTDSTGSGNSAVTVTLEGQELILTPAEHFHGERTLQLKVKSAAGEYSFDVQLTVEAVDDLPTGNTRPVLGEWTTPIALTAGNAFKLIDIDGPSLISDRDGIRIIAYPFAGELLWKETPTSEPSILQLADQRLITIADLEAGNLLYRHNGISVDGALINDYFQYVIVQTNGTVISEPQTLLLADPTKANLDAPEESGGQADPNQPQAPSIAGFNASQGQNTINFNFDFDQKLLPEGGEIRLYLANDPGNWGTKDLLASLPINDPRIAFASDGLSLSLSLPTTGTHLLKGKAGYLMVDLLAQGDVLQTQQGLSLVGNPVFYGTPVDFMGPEVETHSFLKGGSAMVLQLNFSEAVSVVADAKVQLESIHAITGERRLVAALPARSTNGSELLVDLSTLVNSLQLMPGQAYAVRFGEEAGLTDRQVNQPLNPISYSFKLPFPSSSLFDAARANELELPTTDLHLYFGLSSANGESLPIDLMGFGAVDPDLPAEEATLSRAEQTLSSGSAYSLALNLYQSAGNSLPWAEIEGLEVVLRYQRHELWIDPQQFPSATLVEQVTSPEGQVKLKLRFERGTQGWRSEGTGIQLGSLSILPIPNGSAADLPDSFPSLLVSSVSINPGLNTSNPPTISLPQLILNKTNSFAQPGTDSMLLLVSPLVNLQEDSGAITGLIEARGQAGLDASKPPSISSDPNRGSVVLNASTGEWSYTPQPNAFGKDRFTITATDQEGGQRSQTVELVIANVNDTPEGVVVIQITRDGATQPQQGDLLSANVTDLTDADGLGHLTYQWLADGEEIANATGSSLLLRQAQVGQAISVRVSYTDGGLTRETVVSSPTTLVQNVNDAPVGRVEIQGTPDRPDAVLTAVLGSLRDADGLDPNTITWSWWAQGADDQQAQAIAGATTATLELTPKLFAFLNGKRITAQASYTDRAGTPETNTSLPTPAVGLVNSAASGTLAILGSPTQGQTLRAELNLSDPNNPDGTVDPRAVRYQWLANGQEIAGATASTFTLRQAQVGSTITLEVRFTDAAGFSERITSSSTAVVRNVNDAPKGAVLLGGRPLAGATLTATVNLSDADSISATNTTGQIPAGAMSYQWLADGAPINGANGNSFTLTTNEIGKAIRLRVSYTDATGVREQLVSEATSAVLQASPTVPLSLLPPLENQQDPSSPGFSLSVFEGDLRISTLRANHPGTTWSILESPESSRFGVHPTSGILSFRSPAAQEDSPYSITVEAQDIFGNTTQQAFVIWVAKKPAAETPRDLTPFKPDAGDLNGDGIPDGQQPNLAVTPWGTEANYRADNPTTLVTITAESAVDEGRTTRVLDAMVQKRADLPTSVNRSTDTGDNTNLRFSTDFDPLVFRVVSTDAITGEALDRFADLDPNTPDDQVRVTIDLPGDGILANTYLKWNPSLNNGQGGWFEFLADNDLDTYDNGAQLIDLTGDGRINRIVLTFTDGDPNGGDMDGIVNGMIDDPGLTGLLQPSATGYSAFYGGSLPVGQNIDLRLVSQIISNPAALQALAAWGIRMNSAAIDFDLPLDTGRTQANLLADLSLVGSDLELTDNQGRRLTNRRLTYYAIDTAGALLPLAYDPLKKSGARFYDPDGDGIADFLSLSLMDGSPDDLDREKNGRISNVSTAASVDLNPTLSLAGHREQGVLTVGDPNNSVASANLVIRASLTRLTNTANQIGYVILDPTELPTLDTLLNDLNTIRSRAQTLFSTLENTGTTLPAGINFERELLLLNGQSVRFFEVSDASLEEINSLSDSRFRFLSLNELSNQEASLSSPDGVRFSLSLVQADQGLNALIGQEQGLAPVLDFSAFSATQTVSGTLVLGREARYDSITGFYRSIDAQGTVRDANGLLLRPGDIGYADAALRSDNLVSELSGLRVANNQTSTQSIAITESAILAPFAKVNGNTFFAFGAASRDGISHFRTLGTNLFGLEDLVGGGDRDFDDLVLGFSFSSVS